MDEKFHRVIVDGEPYYRKIEFGDLTGDLMCEEDFMDYVMSIVVPTETSIDEDDVDDVISRMYDVDDQQLVSNYIAYLKMAAGM